MFKVTLKKLREQYNLTQKELAKLLNVSDATIGNYEQGLREPRNATLTKIAELFNVSIDYLLGTEEIPDIDDSDIELQEYLEELRTRPEMKMLFSLTKNATKKDVEKAVRIIEAMLTEENN